MGNLEEKGHVADMLQPNVKALGYSSVLFTSGIMTTKWPEGLRVERESKISGFCFILFQLSQLLMTHHQNTTDSRCWHEATALDSEGLLLCAPQTTKAKNVSKTILHKAEKSNNVYFDNFIIKC